MTILERIESLRKDKTPDEIETLLLVGKLGKIYPGSDGYLFTKNILLSHLVVEAHNPGFIECIRAHPKKYVVHHIDGNILNNVYSNLRVMKGGNHIRLHQTDPRFAKTERTRNEKHSAYYTDPANAETEKVRCEKISKSAVAYFADPANAEAIEARNKTDSETKRKNNSWITSDSDPKFFENLFTIEDYAKASNVGYGTAYHRLRSLIRSKEIGCKKELIGSRWCNVYRIAQELKRT